MKIDVKDKKILYQLDLNCRQSNTMIGKKVGLSKMVVRNRIKKLEEQGIIKNYYTVIDGLKLGYVVLRLYIIFQYSTREKKQEIIDYFVKTKSAVVTYSLSGKYDFEVVFWIKDFGAFFSFWQETLNKYGDYFQNQVLSFYIEYITYKLSYLLPEEPIENRARQIDAMVGGKHVDIDDFDFKLLQILAVNARISLCELSNQLGKTSEAIKYRIKKLMKQGIIKAFRPNIDLSKIGYCYFKVDIYLKDYKQRANIIKYIISNPNLFAIDVTTGLSHLELEFHLKDLTELHSLMDGINKMFPLAIRNYNYFLFEEVHKYVFMPDGQV
ncbi:MAG: Lrp/AsnC family transcriptional regulator [Thermoplasmata archaeon]|nr:Lrp/AsnC family transcriptional regulator [Thermoplasmata archaeon]